MSKNGWKKAEEEKRITCFLMIRPISVGLYIYKLRTWANLNLKYANLTNRQIFMTFTQRNTFYLKYLQYIVQ